MHKKVLPVNVIEIIDLLAHLKHSLIDALNLPKQ